MITPKNLALVVLPLLLLSACTLVEVTEEAPLPNAEETLDEIIEEQPVRETKNVTYTGTVQPAGISIYQQGSHRLSIPGGKFILLEADDIDLNGYVGEEVTIFGSLRPTVEAGGMIMRVERIELVAKEETDPEMEEEDLPVNTGEEPEEESVELEPGDENSADPSEVQELPSEDAEDTESEEVPTEEPSEEGIDEKEEEDSNDETASEESSEEVVEKTPEFQERVDVMARQDYAASNWTQQYCSSHIGFCSPVHRNWWFKSFGTTNQKLWHVELSSEPIEAMHQGPISINLLAGDIPVESGTVDVSGTTVTGYAEWTFGRHFVITADASLKDAVEYITNNITEYVQ